MTEIDKLNFDKNNGLIPSIVVDETTSQVLMLGFMNRESLQKTIDTKLVTFFSRSRKSLWTKGETSGNYLKLSKILADCDNDALLIFAKPEGPTCHTGNYSCFGIEKENLNFLKYLFKLIQSRKIELPKNSYTSKLFQEGTNRIIQKVGEEAVETIIAAKNNDKNEIINEVSDLIYHLFVMLVDREIELEDITNKLTERHAK
ncbi:bifunctional phosphoribosyl-AMP cyclohydrolase/phosphoribosyl-ATP diphosphatase HisIE [Melioribacteraceae bacterium 4301-Me]|uniref:bifunctional phosphoribosyl-AMP cyclohydrolase/phosphoribosyl-ATP diphosphatase HisIE n=1 Tax=Pyranulibacter aquaticus TaxID=3163344 RepID=UPI003596B434